MAPLESTAISRPRPSGLIEGYRLEKLVGKGGMGEVHRAVQLSLGRTVAVKLLAEELSNDASFVSRFEKEAAALAQLSHPHVVSIVDKGKSNNTYYLVMEFVDGPSLREVMRSPLLDTQGSLRMVLEICRAIDYAHTRGVVHRDLKPENILFDEQAGGIAKVTDFGLAGFLEEKNSRFNLTETHVAMGTLSYMAPEQRVDAKSADHRADIYSLGVILYELLVGELPVGTFDAPSVKKPGLDRRLDPIVGRCLKPLPNDRYAKVSDLIAELEPLVPISVSLPPRKTSSLQRAKLRLQRGVQRAVRIASAAVVLAALVVLGVATVRTRNHPPPPALAGAQLTEELLPQKATTVAGRISDSSEHRRLSLGEGTDSLALVRSGRPVVVDTGVSFPAATEDGARGRVALDVVDEKGVALSWSGELSVSPPPPSLWASLKTAILGREPEPQGALILSGTAGRYVALVVSGVGQPVSLQWGLGERRGVMLGPISPKAPTVMKLAISAKGELRALWGNDRPIAEPVNLGADWKTYFGRAPTPAVGCIDGVCRMAHLRLDVTREPPPPPVEELVAATPVKTTQASRPTFLAKAPTKHPALAPVRKSSREGNAGPVRTRHR